MAGGPGYRNRPDHKVELIKSDKYVRVIFNDEIVAERLETVLVDEAGHSLVHYFPRGDVRMDCLRRTRHRTYCAFKGEASYYTLSAGGRIEENAVWTYEEPYDEVRELKGCLAFYSDRVDRIEAREKWVIGSGAVTLNFGKRENGCAA